MSRKRIVANRGGTMNFLMGEAESSNKGPKIQLVVYYSFQKVASMLQWGGGLAPSSPPLVAEL